MVSKALDKPKNTAVFRCFVVSICDVFFMDDRMDSVVIFSKSVSIVFGTPTAYYREWAACQSIVSYPPAPRDVVELVKGACNVECKGNCSYANNDHPDHPEHGLATYSCHVTGFQRSIDLPLPKITLFQTKMHCQC